MLQTKVTEKIKRTHFIFDNAFFEISGVCEEMWRKRGTDREATHGNVTWR